ncbi:hypothetical protein ISN45_Aa02g008830 [Arabidopsis thaliana x Arabidopsis arenosa]|uniref:Uncharacterized protein n=1 Tax=Arabidopsis thaliana x Arabidopsis arenosa TaxID=1240361 RepID=A0A8T2BFA2_9BRAS|nr:hypothetical protein ISN45_Aa02g008830 [Arabidopsis thaliana x Arabidopsis arenosa]
MLELEETRLKKSNRASATHKDNSSSSTALTVSAAPSTVSQSQPQKFNNYRGNKKNNNRFRGNRNNNQFRSNYPNWAYPNVWPGPFTPWPNQFANWSPYSQTSTYRGPSVSPQMHQLPHQAHLMEIQPTTDFSQAYTTETLSDPNGEGWIMDSASTAHLSNTAGTLHSNLNHNINHSVIVGNGSKIPVTSIGSSSIHTSDTTSRPLTLNHHPTNCQKFDLCS